MYEWGRAALEMEIVLLDVLAVVALDRGEAEQPFFQDGVVAVPKSWGEDEELIAVAESGDAVLAPAVRLAPRQVVRQVAPGIAVVAVVLADSGRGAVADVGAPAAPTSDIVLDLLQAGVFARAHETRLR